MPRTTKINTKQKGNTSALTKPSSGLWTAQGDPHEFSEVLGLWLAVLRRSVNSALLPGLECWGGERLNEAVELWSWLRLLLHCLA